MSGRRSRHKGARGERALVKYLLGRGHSAERVPLSGAAGGRFASDVNVAVLGADWRIECKTRAQGFRELYRWLDSSDALVVRADRAEPLVVLCLKKALDVLHVVEGARARGRP